MSDAIPNADCVDAGVARSRSEVADPDRLTAREDCGGQASSRSWPASGPTRPRSAVRRPEPDSRDACVNTPALGSSRPVRVLLVSPCFGAYGGIEAFVLAVADAVGQDHRFEVRICFKRTARFAVSPELERACRSYAVEFVDRASRALLEAVAWADIVHAQNAPPDVAVAAAITGKPMALSIHNCLPLRPRVRRLSWQLAARLASARWFNSEFVWRTWEPNPALDSLRVPPLAWLPAVATTEINRKGFVFIGRLVSGKGVEVLIEAYARARVDAEQWPLTICGVGPLESELKKRAQVVCPAVRFAGFVDGPAKAAALRKARWLVVPSHYDEPFGLVAVEARHQATPCVVTRDGGLPEAAGRDALMCEPEDVPSLAAALRMAAEMPDDEYLRRSQRTKADLADELVPISFYTNEYLRLASRAADRIVAQQTARS